MVVVFFLATLAATKPLDIKLAMLMKGAWSPNSTFVPPGPPGLADPCVPFGAVTNSMTAIASTPRAIPTSTSEITIFSSTTTAPTASSSKGATSTPTSYAQAILDQHNNHHANSSGPDLTWSPDMASIADQIAASCTYVHDLSTMGGGYGRNIGAGAEPSAVPSLITKEMYNNEIGPYPLPYGQDNPDVTLFNQWGHYSQIMWQPTTSVGCATQHYPGGLVDTDPDESPYFTVCNYSPPDTPPGRPCISSQQILIILTGDVAGEYSNVGAPNNKLPSVEINA